MPGRTESTIAIIVPVYREPEVNPQLEAAYALGPDELIVVESGDALTQQALGVFFHSRAPGDSVRVLQAPRGRALQMNAGARAARSDVLLFLHADTLLPPDGLALVRRAIAQGALWGRFDVRLSGTKRAYRCIESLMNMRSAVTGIATGDQAMFVRRDVYTMLGGFAPIALMEDVDFSSRLQWVDRPARIRTPVVTSSRRWERDGTLRTMLRMWVLRALFACGVSPQRLARWYK